MSKLGLFVFKLTVIILSCMICSKDGSGPLGWEITPNQMQTFGRSNGGQMNHPPLGYVVEYLDFLQSYGYRVVGTHSLYGGETHTTMSWTLQTQ